MLAGFFGGGIFCDSLLLGEQGGGELDGGYAEVGPKEAAKCRKSPSLSLLPGAFLKLRVFGRF